MRNEQGAANCRWAVPTLFLNSPAWIDSVDRPWTCMRDETPHELELTDSCRNCVRWEPRATAPVSFGEPCDHLGTQPYFLDIF
jgi:hypothetical protein